MKLCSIGYVPPKTFPGASAFYENIRRFKTKFDLVLFSDDDWPDLAIRLKMSPEHPYRVIAHGKTALNPPHKFAINNVLWFTALKMARTAGYSHLLYLESDCRVGCDHWDERMFEEYFGLGRALVAGGSLGVYNPANWNRRATDKWCELVSRHYVRKNMPVPSYGWKGAADRSPVCVFPNGALSIVSIEWMHELFDLTQGSVALAVDPCQNNKPDRPSAPSPFDMALGIRLWQRFEEESYDVLGHLTCAYSTYGDIITTPEERREMLTSGKVVACHHYKDQWKP